MKTVKKSIKEDKIITKEDDCGAPMGGGDMGGGEIAPPSIGGGAEPFTNDVIPTVPMDSKTNGSVKIEDVLGVNPVKDKNCTGFFANGSFHVPFPIFTAPVYKNKKNKKQKRPKVIDLTEDAGYDMFLEYCKKSIQNIIDEAEKEMKVIDPEITVRVDYDYDFGDYKSDWVAALNKTEQESPKEFIVGFNFPILYNYLYEHDKEQDFKEIDCQLKASLYHELGHAILQYFADTELMDFELSDKEEEEAVEEYANYKLKEFTGAKFSSIQNFIDEVLSANEEEKKINETHAHDTFIEKYTPPTFTVPINIKNRRVVPNTWKQKILNKEVSVNQISKKFSVSESENILTDGENSIGGEITLLLVRGIKGVPAMVRIDKQGTESENKEDNTEFFIPTLIDIIRLCYQRIQTLPLSYLTLVDNMDEAKGYNSFTTEDESIYNTIKNCAHLKDDRTGRYDTILSMYTPQTISSSVLYAFLINRKTGEEGQRVDSLGVLLREGVYLGYRGTSTAQGLQTAYFIEPCEVVEILNKCSRLNAYNGADKSNIPVELLFNSLENIIQHRTYTSKFIGSRRTSFPNRRYIEKTDVAS